MAADQGTATVQGAGQVLPSIRHANPVISSAGAPPAHQSPKNSQAALTAAGGAGTGPRGTTRPAPPDAQYMLISSPKKTRFATTLGGPPNPTNPSILRNQLINKVHSSFYKASTVNVDISLPKSFIDLKSRLPIAN